MTAPSATRGFEARSDPDHPDRHHQLHRLPGVPGGLQAVERARGREDRAEAQLGFQNPATLSAQDVHAHRASTRWRTRTEPGRRGSAFVMQRCLHCLEPACVSACPTTALYRQADGPVSYDVDDCIGCRYCMLACPWDVPTAEWNSRAPKIAKCTHCADRADQPLPIAFNGQRALRGRGPSGSPKRIATPACVKACPADALRYGTRDEMLALAHKRIADRPDKYVDHIYGEKELGGTSVRVPVGHCRSRSSAFRPTGRSRFRASPRRRSAPCPPP